MTSLKLLSLSLVLSWLWWLSVLPVYAPLYSPPGNGSKEADDDSSYLRLWPVIPGITELVADWPRPTGLPTFKGGIRAIEETEPTGVVWVTFYSAATGATVASEHPDGFRPGIAASYAIREPSGRISSAATPGYGIIPFGQGIVVEGVGRVEVWDTGPGFPDARPWLDIGVSDRKMAVELGASRRKVWILGEVEND